MTAYNRNTLLVGMAVAVLIGGGVSYFASSAPDGLEKSQQELGAGEPGHDGLAAPPIVFHEYGLKGMAEGFWSNAIAGAAGAFLVLIALLAVGRLLARGRRVPAQPVGSAGGDAGSEAGPTSP
jgi:hypothetical protein